MNTLTRSLFVTPWLVAVPLMAGPFAAVAADEQVTADQVVTALEETFGITPGERRNHTKGMCAAGEFVGTPEAMQYSRSSLFSGERISVVARFSLPGGNPKAPDSARSPRGMALEFKLPDGRLQHMTMLNTPMFGAAHPRTFLDLIKALRPDPGTGKPDPGKIKAFKATHPDNKAQADFLASHNPPTSYANSAYFGIHTFRFIDADGRVTGVRWRFVPQDGEASLTHEEMQSLPRDFLEQRLIERTKQKPIRWDMWIAIGESGDSQDDPTVLWPKNRRQVKAGTLTISSAMPQKGAECEKINFDPLVMGDGIAPTDDPVLMFRSPAYAVSFGKRMSGQ